MWIFLGYFHLFNKTIERDIGQYLLKAIDNHFFSQNVKKFNFLYSQLIMNVVVLNINMFYFRVEDRVMC